MLPQPDCCTWMALRVNWLTCCLGKRPPGVRFNLRRSNVRGTSQKFSLSQPANLSTGTNDSFPVQWHGACSTHQNNSEQIAKEARNVWCASGKNW
jgi:hypothetical protein